MPTVANSLIDRNAATIQELIGTSAKEYMSDTDPVFRDMILANMQVIGENVLGRDLRVKKRFYGSLAGVIRSGTLNNFFSLFGDQTSAMGPKIFRQQLSSVFPNALESANPRPFGLTATLHSVETNLPLTLSQLQLEALPANIQEHITPVFRGFARNISIWAANGFYADSTNQYRLASLGPSSGTGAYVLTAGTPNYIDFYPVEKSTHRFATGQQVDIYKTATTRANKSDSTNSRTRMFVSTVDDWTNLVRLVCDNTAEDGTTSTFGTWATTGNIGASAFVVYANSAAGTSASFKGLYSWRDWLKAGDPTGATASLDQILGSNAITDTTDDYINVKDHKEFKSGLYSSVGALNRNKFLGILSNVHRALIRNQFYVDTLIASEGVWLNMFDQQLSRETLMYTGGGSQVGNLNMGLKDGFEIVHEGKTYQGYTSRFLEDGVLIGIRRKGNWALVVPPDPQGTSRSAPGMSDLEGKIPLVFVMPALTGTSSIRFPIIDQATGLLTEGTQMPGYIRMQFMPTQQIPGFSMTGISTTRTFST